MGQERVLEATGRPARVLIDPMALASIRAEVDRCYPAEAIGLLAGTVHSGHVVVGDAVALTNLARNPRVSVQVSNAERDQALADLAARGMQAIGAYHSHPNGAAEPSAEDTIRGTGLEIIAAASRHGTGVVRAWWLERGRPPIELAMP